MDLAPIFGLLFFVAFLALIIWVPMEFLRKAGFSRVWVFLIVLTSYLGLIAFAFLEWPIERELAWHRYRAGDTSEATTALVESYAVALEKSGDWKQAEEVFLELKRKAISAESAEYFASCLNRLRELTQATELA